MQEYRLVLCYSVQKVATSSSCVGFSVTADMQPAGKTGLCSRDFFSYRVDTSGLLSTHSGLNENKEGIEGTDWSS